ncbi:hypothetical protein OEZ85_002285 [Tetradesmus obliquus]|uniref:Uncharacterized protein n=2 Tax=Tetradesmus obliquus TaxID=3088 RepID=A0A383W0K9_TETOB|nr:hypothetical protein OEZ85_002285 [Tetradesmus obliquus]|eukprot:jgi/Sobl393_1/4016/SZX71228.1
MLAPAIAGLLLLACSCSVSATVDLGLPHPLPADGNLFPAGIPTFKNPYAEPWYQEPPLPKNYYRGAYEHVTCPSDELVVPEDTAQLAAAIKSLRARAAAEGRPLKMRPARRGFATMASFACGPQPTLVNPFLVDGKKPMVVGLMLEKMDKVLAVDKEKQQLRVQGQMTLKGFYEAADAAGLSVPRFGLPWWQGLTLGGVFSTASHGSGNNVTHMICDWFVDVTWVDAQGEVHTSAKGSDEAFALCGGLGLLGTVTELTLQLTPSSNTHFSTWYLKPDDNLADDVEAMLKITPNLVVMWRPDLGKYTGHLQRPAPEHAPTIQGAQCNVIPQQADYQAGMSGPLLRAWQGDPFNTNTMYFAGYDTNICTLALTSAIGAPWVTKKGPLTSKGISQPVFEGVAPTNHVTSTDCGDNCVFTSKKLMSTALDVMFAFERSKLKEWVADIKALIKEDLRGIPGWGAHTRCLLPGYYVMRFGRPSDTLVGYGSGLQQPVYVQQQMMASKATPGIPSRYEWVQETYEQLTLCKYDGRPHTGKNWDRTFTNPRCPFAPKFGESFKKMVAMQDKYDPSRAYEPELWTRLAAGEGYKLKPKCILDRSCYCEADEHCADGFKCVASVAFPQYKACRPKVMN